MPENLYLRVRTRGGVIIEDAKTLLSKKIACLVLR